MNSSKASLKSVVMWGCVSAEPKFFGCGSWLNSPSLVALRPSFSIPRSKPQVSGWLCFSARVLSVRMAHGASVGVLILALDPLLVRTQVGKEFPCRWLSTKAF